MTKTLKKTFGSLAATFLLAGTLVVAPTVVDNGAGQAQAATCGVAGLYNSGYSMAVDCARSQYREKVDGKWYYATAKGKWVKSQFSVCHYKWQASGAQFWY